MANITQEQQSTSALNVRARNMQMLAIPLFTALALPISAEACPMGMQPHGDICVTPAYSADDWIREQYEYIDSLGPENPAPSRPLTPEEVEDLKKLQAEKEKKDLKMAQELAQGVWFSDPDPAPEGKLCAATFAKMTREDNGKSGGMVSILGVQDPKKDAWLVFYGTGLPKPKKVRKIKITLQQDDGPAQDVQAVNYRYIGELGVVAFAGPRLAVALDGMHDKQSFKLSLDGKSVMTIEWADAAPMLEQLKQCAK